MRIRGSPIELIQFVYWLALVALLFSAPPARAIPSFAQQTGLACSSCHVGAFGPQLKPFARDFKLWGYQASDGKRNVLPIAATTQVSFTHTQQPQYPQAQRHFAANDNFAIDQTSLYYGGKAAGGFGAFAQVTYDGLASTMHIDNIDVRKVKAYQVGGKDVVFGIDFNNSPGVQDAWQATPAWTFPYNGSGLAPGMATATVIDGTFAQSAFGAGAYVFWDYSLYAELTGYKALAPVFAGRLGLGENSQSDVYAQWMPYWRIALNHDFENQQSFEIGAYGLDASRAPGGVSNAGLDHLDDTAVDLNYFNQTLKTQVFSLHATWIHEDQNLAASEMLFGANPKGHLDTRRADLSWSYRDTLTPTIQAFSTTGPSDKAIYPTATGSPNSSGYVLELAYTPWGKPNAPFYWLNCRMAIQYTGYREFNGDRANASAANTTYVSFWTALAPLGWLVSR